MTEDDRAKPARVIRADLPPLARVVLKHLAVREWTAGELARRMGMSHPMLSRLLSGSRAPSPADLARLASALEVPILSLAADAGLTQIFDEFVPREYLLRIDAARVDAQRRASALGAEVASKATELEHFRRAVVERETELRGLKRKLAESDLEKSRAQIDQLTQMVVNAEVEKVTMQATISAQRARIDELRRTLDEQRHAAQHVQARQMVMESRAAALRQGMEATSSTSMLSALLRALAALPDSWITNTPTTAPIPATKKQNDP